MLVPLVFPAIAAGSIFTFSLTLGDYIAVGIVGGKTQLLANVIYGQLVTANNQPLAAALVDRAARRDRALPCGDAAYRRVGERLMYLTARARLALRAFCTLVGAGVPLRAARDRRAELVQQSRTSSRSRRPGSRCKWWDRAAAQQRRASTALWTSVRAGLGATAIALVLGTMAAFAVQRYRFFGRSTISFLVILPIALPGIVTGIALNAALSSRASG